jgi:Domain of unknown function (DUF4149)
MVPPAIMSAMSFLRFLMLLSLIVWIGGLLFFAFVVAPAAFAVLPTRHLAGNLVGRTLEVLHWAGIFSGLIFLASSLLYSRFTRGKSHAFAGPPHSDRPDAGFHTGLAIWDYPSHGRVACLDR